LDSNKICCWKRAKKSSLDFANFCKETVVDDETEDEIQKDEEGSTNEDIDESKEQNGEVESDKVLSAHENESIKSAAGNVQKNHLLILQIFV
jgi:hypothetical protein